MAKTVEDFTIKRAGREGESIDFDKYFDGKVHQLEHGKDFKVSVATFRQKANVAGKGKGGHAEVRVNKDQGLVELKFHKNGRPKKAKKS